MRAGQISFPGQQEADLRKVLTAAELADARTFYFDLKPYVSGATASLTLSATLEASGTGTLANVTLTGPLTFRQIKISYAVGGANPQYRIDCGDGWNAATGFTGTFVAAAGATVPIGGGTSVVFPVGGAYNADNVHWSKSATWAELSGKANASLTDVLSGGHGHRTEAHGMGGVLPSLYMYNSGSGTATSGTYLANSLALPAAVSGVDVAFEIWMLAENWGLPPAGKSWVPLGYSHTLVANNAKNILDLSMNGAGAEAWVIARLDGGGAPAFARFISTFKPDLSPKVIRAVVGANSQVYVNGLPTRPAGNQSTNRAATTSLDQCILGALPFGTTAPTNSFPQMRVTTLLMVPPLAAGREVAVGRAMAGRAAQTATGMAG
ncbi:MAG TPA: hypothetical protein VNG33_23550 [Polyangiaceae bacterium]|nr:hypothetical protein [Polyangiaceae bacterium]